MEYWKLINEITYKNYYISNLGRGQPPLTKVSGL